MKLRDAQKEIERINNLGDTNPFNELCNESHLYEGPIRAGIGTALSVPTRAATTVGGAYGGSELANKIDRDSAGLNVAGTGVGGYYGYRGPNIPGTGLIPKALSSKKQNLARAKDALSDAKNELKNTKDATRIATIKKNIANLEYQIKKNKRIRVHPANVIDYLSGKDKHKLNKKINKINKTMPKPEVVPDVKSTSTLSPKWDGEPKPQNVTHNYYNNDEATQKRLSNIEKKLDAIADKKTTTSSPVEKKELSALEKRLKAAEERLKYGPKDTVPKSEPITKPKSEPVTKAYKGNYGSEKGFAPPKPETPAEIKARLDAEAERARQIKGASDATYRARYAREEKAAIERLARQGKVTGITDAMIAKEIANPTKLDPRLPTANQVNRGPSQAALNAKETLKQEAQAEKIVKKAGDGIKISSGSSLATPPSAQGITIGDDAGRISKQALSKKALEKMGIVTTASKNTIKQALKIAATKGSKYLALSFIPGLNIALWGHDAYAVTRAVQKSMDPTQRDVSDAGRHRQVALQQMSQVMLSDAPMDSKIDQIEHLFSNDATKTTLPELQAQQDAGRQQQHFVTANPEFQAQLDKGPQALAARNEDIWNSSYDNEETILSVSFDEAGNIASGPNTKSDFKNALDDLYTAYNEVKSAPSRSKKLAPWQRDRMAIIQNQIEQAQDAMKTAPDDRKTAFKSYVFSTLAQSEALIATNESSILQGALLSEGPLDWGNTWLDRIRRQISGVDPNNLPKSGGKIAGKTSLGKRTKNLHPSEINALKNVSPRHKFTGKNNNNMVRVSGISTPGQPMYNPANDIKDFKPDTVAQAKADYKKPKIKKPVLTKKDIAKHNAMARNISLVNVPPTTTKNGANIKAKQSGKKVSSAISQALGSIESSKNKNVAKPLIGDNGLIVTVGKGKGKTRLNNDEEKLFAQIKAKRKKYSKYSKAEQKLMMKVGLVQRTFKQAHAEAKADSANLKTMKLKNGKTLKYFVWNGKKYTV